MKRIYACEGESSSFGQLKADPVRAKKALFNSYELVDLRREGEYIVESRFKTEFDLDQNVIYLQPPKTKGDVLNSFHSIGLYFDLLVPAMIQDGFIENGKIFDEERNLQFKEIPKIVYKNFKNVDFELILDTPERLGYANSKELDLLSITNDSQIESNYDWYNFNQGTDYIFANYKTRNIESLWNNYKLHCLNKINFVSTIYLNNVSNPSIKEVLRKTPAKKLYGFWDEFVDFFVIAVKEKKHTFEESIDKLKDPESYIILNKKALNDYVTEGKLSLDDVDLRTFPSEEVLKLGKHLNNKEDNIKEAIINSIVGSLSEDDTSCDKGKKFRTKIEKYVDTYQFENEFFIEKIKSDMQKTTSFKKEEIFNLHNNQSYLIVPTHVFFQKIKQYEDMLRRMSNLNIAITSNEENTIFFDTRRSGFSFNGFPKKLRNGYLRNIKSGKESYTNYNSKEKNFINPAVKFADLERLLKQP